MRFLILLITIFLIPISTYSKVVNFNWPEKDIPKSDKYSVKVYQNGKSHTIFTHIQRTRIIGEDGGGIASVWEDRTNSFVQFDFDSEIVVEISKIYGKKASRIEISPKSFGINPIFFDGFTVKFKMKRPQYLSINFICDDNKDSDGAGGDDIKNSMLIFANNIETEKPDTTKPGVVFYKSGVDISNASLIYFKKGYYNLSNFSDKHLPIRKSGVSIYVEGGAFINGGVDFSPNEFDGVDNVKLYGRGIMSMEIFPFHDPKKPMIEAMGCKNSYFEGLVFCASTHHTGPAPSDGSVIKNIKILGCAYNNDGIRPTNNCIIDHIFIKTTDDHDYARDNGIVTNSVFWPTRNGAVQQLGWNKYGKGGKRFKNNYIINAEWQNYHPNGGVFGSQVKQGAYLSNDTLENIVCENNTSMLVNLKMDYSSSNSWDSNNPGEIKDFVFKNIVLENDFRANNGKMVKQVIHGFTHNNITAYIHDIKFINIVAGNTVITQQNYKKYFDIDTNTTYNILFQTQGNIYSIKSKIYGKGSVVEGDSIPVFEKTDRNITILPDDGYKIDSVIVDNQNLGRVQVYTFKNVNKNHNVKLYFSKGEDYFDLLEQNNFEYNLKVDLNAGLYPLINYNLPNNYLTPVLFYIYKDSNQIMSFYDNTVTVGQNDRTINRVDELVNGEYVLKLKTGDMFVDSTNFIIGSTSVIKELNSNKISIFPNPVHNKIFINTKINGCKISIVNSNGVAVKNNISNVYNFKNSIPKGRYYVVITKNCKIMAIKEFYKIK